MAPPRSAPPPPALKSCALEDGLGLVTHIQQREQDKSEWMSPEVALYKDCGPLSALGHQLPYREGSGAASTGLRSPGPRLPATREPGSCLSEACQPAGARAQSSRDLESGALGGHIE